MYGHTSKYLLDHGGYYRILIQQLVSYKVFLPLFLVQGSGQIGVR